MAPRTRLVQTELRATLRAALVTMPDVERTVIVLAYTDGLTQSEIAERLGWPLGTVKTRTRRALLHMRALLAEHHDPGLQPVPIPVEMGESMNHVEVRERMELAALEPDGLERLMAGDTLEAAAIATPPGGLSGLPRRARPAASVPRRSSARRSNRTRGASPGRARR